MGVRRLRVLCLCWLLPGLATVGHADSTPGSPDPEPARYERSIDRDLRLIGERAFALEKASDFIGAAELYEKIVRRAPRNPAGYWKVARNTWRYAETLPTDAKQRRLRLFERANDWATRGLTVNPDCAECMLWKFSAMGRIATTSGALSSLRNAPEMRDLLVRGIALQPSYADDLTNSTLGNLYYAGAVFYRVVPDWALLNWTIGVKGDLDTSLEMIRNAVGISASRIDYQVELGAILLCISHRDGSQKAAEEGRRVLERAPNLERQLGTDETDIEHAGILLREPEKACGYSRDGWIDFGEKENAEANFLR